MLVNLNTTKEVCLQCMLCISTNTTVLQMWETPQFVMADFYEEKQ